MHASRAPFAALATAVVVALLVLTGCASPQAAPAPERDRFNVAPPEVVPSLVSGGSADENLEYFIEVLRQYSVGAESITGEPIVNAIVAAGFDRSAMQVSFDKSKTNLVADSIYVSVLIEQDCLVGQLVTGDRSFVAEAVSAVGPDRNICLIGSTRPIDW